MSDIERATVTSSSSQLETVQPFTIDESPGLEVGIESPKLMDSSTLMCTSIGKSPAAKYSKQKHHHRQKVQRTWTNSNQAREDQPAAATTTAPGTSGDSSDRSVCSSEVVSSTDDNEAEAEDYATNQSAKSTATAVSSASSSKTNTNTNRGSDALGESEYEVTGEGYSPEADRPPGESEEDDDTEGGRDQSSTDAGATGVQSTDSETGEPTDSVFANLAETTEGAGSAEPDKPPQRQSQRMNKNEIANMIEKAILDFCSSRTVETMRRMFAGVTNDTETLQRDGGRHDDKSASTPHPVTGELVKEGVIIGDVDVFSPRMQREFILPVRDSLIAAFLKEPGVFRAICYRTRCQVEVTRRLLNRKLCVGGRWHKYMIIRIVGPTYKCIQNCDILLQKAVPSYKQRKEYLIASVCRMFLREDVPDNADLYYNFQRTGGTCQRYGALKLESPFRSTSARSIGNCPWKYGLFKVGKLAFKNAGVRLCMKHVYPSMGYQTSSNLEREYQGVNAADRIHMLYDQFQVRRQSALALKRTLTIPVCR